MPFYLALGLVFFSVIPGGAAANVRRRVPILWTTTTPAQPYVIALVGDAKTHALLDTGASDHVFSLSFAHAAGLPTVAIHAQGVDHGAGALALRGLVHVTSRIEGWGPLDASLSTPKDGLAYAVAVVHDRFRELGLGAFVSPQRLVTRGHAVVIDLQKSELVELPAGELRSYLDGHRGRALFTGSAEACKHGTGARAGITWTTDALIEGHAARLLVDTGAASGDLFRDSPVGRAIQTRGHADASIVTARGPIAASRVDGLTLRLGDLQFHNLRWDVVPAQGAPVCRYDGVLGINVLRNCVVAFDGTAISGRCTEPPGAPEPNVAGESPAQKRQFAHKKQAVTAPQTKRPTKPPNEQGRTPKMRP